MNKVLKYSVSLIVISVVLGGLSVILVPGQRTGTTSLKPEREAEEILGNQLRATAEQELAIGETAINRDGERMFSGGTAEKMKKLNEAAEKQIDELIARPQNEREAAIASISAFGDTAGAAKEMNSAISSNPRIEYQRTSRSSYQRDVPVEIYYSGADQFEVDARNNQIIQFGPRPEPDDQSQGKVYDLSPRYSPVRLNKMARRLASGIVLGLDSRGLMESTTNKEGLVYFFRWEDKSRRAEGLFPFVQIGLSRGGDVVSFTNTLDLPIPEASDSAEQPSNHKQISYSHGRNLAPFGLISLLSATGVWIFANNGNGYSQYGPSSYWWTTYNEGYCGHLQLASWCVPRYMRYTYESKSIWTPSNYARWSHPGWDGGWGIHKVFIPRVNATTTHASYSIVYSGASTYNFGLSQLAYSDAWVQTSKLYAIGATWLYDTPWGGTTPTGKKVGFDEIEIIY